MGSQIDNFRKSLGLPLKDEENGGSAEQTKGNGYHTVMVKEENFIRYRLLSIWLTREKKMKRISFDDVFGMALDAYLRADLDAQEYLERSL